MFYTLPTKNGLGIKLWGTYDDLKNLFDVIGKFCSDENYTSKKGAANRDELISGFSYELRHAFQGSRLKSNHSHFTLEQVPYYGCTFSWVHVIFSLAALRQNISYIEANKFDLGMFLILEFWLEKAMNTYDEDGARAVIPYLNGGIYLRNEYMYQYIRSINVDFFNLRVGKKAFKKLSFLLKRGVYRPPEFQAYLQHLSQEAKCLQCDISEVEIDDGDKIYEIECLRTNHFMSLIGFHTPKYAYRRNYCF